MIKLSALGITQDGFRHSESNFRSMISHAQHGLFDKLSLSKFDPHKTSLIAIAQFEDGKQFIRDGFHRGAAAYIARGKDSCIFDEEYVIEHYTYAMFNQINIDAKYYTPFYLKTKVRKADFYNFRKTVENLIKEGKDPEVFIWKNQHKYSIDRQDKHQSLGVYVDNYLKENPNQFSLDSILA